MQPSTMVTINNQPPGSQRPSTPPPGPSTTAIISTIPTPVSTLSIPPLLPHCRFQSSSPSSSSSNNTVCFWVISGDQQESPFTALGTVVRAQPCGVSGGCQGPSPPPLPSSSPSELGGWTLVSVPSAVPPPVHSLVLRKAQPPPQEQCTPSPR